MLKGNRCSISRDAACSSPRLSGVSILPQANGTHNAQTWVPVVNLREPLSVIRGGQQRGAGGRGNCTAKREPCKKNCKKQTESVENVCRHCTWRANKVSAESNGKERKRLSPKIPFVREKNPRSW